MPITFPAHQLLVLPFLRASGGRLPGSALMLGATLPDLAFIVGGYGFSGPAHEPYGPLLVAPLGVVFYVWTELQLAPALQRALPAQLGRLFRVRGLPARPRDWAYAIAALVLGAFTHVVFDGLTHHWMWPADPLYADVRLGGVRLTQLLHGATSILASIAVLTWGYRRLQSCRPIDGHARWREHLVAGVLISVACAAFGLAAWLLAMGWPVRPREWKVLICPIAAAAGLGVAAAIWHRSRRGWS